jgi:hypothetical protein
MPENNKPDDGSSWKGYWERKGKKIVKRKKAQKGNYRGKPPSKEFYVIRQEAEKLSKRLNNFLQRTKQNKIK